MTLEGFGIRLRGLRKAAGLTQQELANRAGLTREGIAQLETGRRSPAWATVEALCRALQVGPDAFTSAGEEKPAGSRTHQQSDSEPDTRTTTRAEAEPSSTVPKFAGPDDPLKLLLVEDDDDVALLIRKSLERVGHHV